MKSTINNFEYYIEQKTKSMTTLLRKDQQIFKLWIDETIRLYNTIAHLIGRQPTPEYSSIASLWAEIIDTLDGIRILHAQSAINPSSTLVRKLFELVFQLIFMLESDSTNKSLAYEAYYVSRMTQGKDDNRNIYKKYSKYKEYKKEADKAFSSPASSGAFKNWYHIYDVVEGRNDSEQSRNNQLNSMRSLIKKLTKESPKGTDAKNERGFYLLEYSILSQESHGFRSRNYVKVNGNENYIESFRNPTGIFLQTDFCHLLILKGYEFLCKHYKILPNVDIPQKVSNILGEMKTKEKDWKKEEQARLP